MHRFAVLGFVLVVLVFSALLLFANPSASGAQLSAASPPPADVVFENTQNLSLSFSETGYFYKESIEVAITASVPDAKIYYTTDGSEPTSTAGKEYSEPLRFEAPDDLDIVVLKAAAVYGESVTRPLAHTYFLGGDADERFDTLVFSLSTNDEYLYDYETGIFVSGKLRDDHMKENPNEFIQPPAPANFNMRGMEGERPVYVEVFTPEGERVVAQAAGLRLSGGWSRANDQKALRLIARKEYEPNVGKFHYNFFPGETLSGDYGEPLTEFNSMVLRAGANDRDLAMLRNETAVALARDAGFRDASPSRAAAVFLNGEYYGFAWLQVSLDEQYLQNVYNTPTKDFDIIGNGEEWYESDNLDAISDLKELYTFSAKNLNDDTVFAEFESMVDVDNMLFYYAYEIYMGNDDWPHNNMKRWRYTGPATEGQAPQLDGRWRFLLYDLDWTLGLYGEQYNVPTFRNVLVGSKRRSELLISLLKRPELAEKFSMYICDIASAVASTEKVRDKIEALYTEAEHEITTAISAHKYSFWVTNESVLENHGDMVNFASKRVGFILENLRDYFDYEEEMFEIRVSGGEAVIGSQKSAASRYFSTLTVPVSPALPKYAVFDHWIVNGKTVYEPNITVSANDAVNGIVNIELVTHSEIPSLTISDIYSSPQRNGCVLTNNTDKPVRTDGLYVSDTIENPLRCALPTATVAPGGSLILVGKGSSDVNDLLKIGLNFNVKNGSILLLSDETGKVLDYLILN